MNSTLDYAVIFVAIITTFGVFYQAWSNRTGNLPKNALAWTESEHKKRMSLEEKLDNEIENGRKLQKEFDKLFAENVELRKKIEKLEEVLKNNGFYNDS